MKIQENLPVKNYRIEGERWSKIDPTHVEKTYDHMTCPSCKELMGLPAVFDVERCPECNLKVRRLNLTTIECTADESHEPVVIGADEPGDTPTG
jgi:hypothetical protein